MMLQKKHALIAALGSKVFDKLCGLCSPTSPADKSYADLKVIAINRYKSSHMKSTQRQLLSVR
jgi:hypothetical protein